MAMVRCPVQGLQKALQDLCSSLRRYAWPVWGAAVSGQSCGSSRRRLPFDGEWTVEDGAHDRLACYISSDCLVCVDGRRYGGPRRHRSTSSATACQCSRLAAPPGLLPATSTYAHLERLGVASLESPQRAIHLQHLLPVSVWNQALCGPLRLRDHYYHATDLGRLDRLHLHKDDSMRTLQDDTMRNLQDDAVA